MAANTIKATAVAVVVGIAAYWYWSPLLAIRQMQNAAQAGDADTFNEHVDYPRLRESLKGQFSAMFTKRLGKAPAESGGDISKAGAALGTMLGLAMVDRFVDAMIRPEVVMRAMQEGKLAPQAPSTSAPASSGGAGSDEKPKWTTERKGVDKYIAHGGRADAPVNEQIGLILERSGFATWKLTEVRLPNP